MRPLPAVLIAAGALAVPATAHAQEPAKPLMTRTDARDTVSLCWWWRHGIGSPDNERICRIESDRSWKPMTGHTATGGVVRGSRRHLVLGKSSCVRYDRLTVACQDRFEFRWRTDQDWSNYRGSRPPRWSCTRTHYVTWTTFADGVWQPGYLYDQPYGSPIQTGPDCDRPQPEPADGWSED